VVIGRILHIFSPSLRPPSAWPLLLRCSRLDDETALHLGWQRNPRLIDRSDDQRFHVWMCQPTGRFHLDEACLLSRPQQNLVRVGQLRSLTEVQRYTGGPCGDRHDGIDPAVRRRIADNEEAVVVVRQLVGGRESLAYSSPDRSNELLILRIKPVDVGPELSLGRRFPSIASCCHRILPAVPEPSRGYEPTTASTIDATASKGAGWAASRWSRSARDSGEL